MNAISAMPDLDPTLKDQKVIETEQVHLDFSPSGQYAASTHYILIWVPVISNVFDLQPIISKQLNPYGMNLPKLKFWMSQKSVRTDCNKNE